jgi:glutamate dehydrogenase (NAD(P)+)
MATDQFDLIANYLQIPTDLRDRLKFPKRSIGVSVPVRMDDGSTRVFQGYRVQHTLAMGPGSISEPLTDTRWNMEI